MSGKIEISNYFILLISIIACLTDLTWRRIFNWLTLPAILIGFGVSTYYSGSTGVIESFLGLMAGFLLYGWMFGLRLIGGGDVKLLMAFGAWGGLHYAVDVALLGVLVGGVISTFILIFNGKMLNFLKRMYAFFLSLYVKELELQVPKIDQSMTIPFGVPISLAAVWVAFGHPLEQWGFMLWH